MAKYVVEIDYTANIDKAAKIRIIDQSEKVILKSDVILPIWMHEKDDYMSQLEMQKFIYTDYSPLNYFANVNKLSEFHNVLGNSYIKSKANYMKKAINIIKKDDFYANSNQNVKGHHDLIVLPTEFFETLKSIISDEENIVILDATKKLFVFGQKPCERKYDPLYEKYISLGQNIESEEKALKQKERIEQSRRHMDEFTAMLNKYPSPTLDEPPSLPTNHDLNKLSPLADKNVKDVLSKYRNQANAITNPYMRFQEIYQSFEAQYGFESSKNTPSSDSRLSM
jgi:hypothetical protein